MVDRYDPELDSETWIRSETGQVVFYADYEALEAKLAACKRTMQGHSYCGQHGLYRDDSKMEDVIAPCPSCELSALRARVAELEYLLQQHQTYQTKQGDKVAR